MLTYREARYVRERVVNDKTRGQALLAAGFSVPLSKHPDYVETPEMLAEVERLRAELVDAALHLALIDGIEIHQQLTDELRGDIADLYTEAGELKPVKDWPMWARNGGVEVLDEPNMVHSADGGDSSWDQQGRRIKVKMGSRAKTRELAMRHKGVNAMVSDKGADVHVHLHAEIIERLQGARAREAKLLSSGSVPSIEGETK